MTTATTTATTQLIRTRASDPTAQATLLRQPGETVLTRRGDHRSADAIGPHADIVRLDGTVRATVVSQRDSTLGYDD